jgi:type III secretion protein J
VPAQRHRSAARPLALATLAALGLSCSAEALLHGLDEASANEVVVALDQGGVAARKIRPGDSAEGYTVEVASSDAAQAQRILAARELPRARPAGFGEVFARGGLVPTATEEHALYLHALAGELSRSLGAIDGVVGARVHLALPEPDPLRPGDRPPPRAAVLVRCRPAACEAVRALEPGIQALVAGAAARLEPSAVAVVVAEAPEIPAPPRPPPGRPPLALAGLLGLGLVAAAGAAFALRAWLRSRHGVAPPPSRMPVPAAPGIRSQGAA